MSPKNVLIVDDEKALLQSIESGFEPFQDRFRVFTAADGRAAVEILESRPVDLVVTDLHMPVMDGIELLAYMNTRFPGLPASVITAFRDSKAEKLLRSMGVLSLLDKPVAFDDLIRCVEDGLKLSAQGGSLTGVSIGGFLQLIEMEKKTCLLEVSAEFRRAGAFLFVDGVLCDAWCGGLRGEDAAMEMVGWERARMALKDVPPTRHASRTVRRSLMKILLEGSRRKDETTAGSKGRRIVPGERWNPEEEPVRAPSSEGGTGRSGDLSREEIDAIWPALNRDSRYYRMNRSKVGLKPLLARMSEEMPSPILLGVVGLDGTIVASRSPEGVDPVTCIAKTSMLVKLAAGAASELGDAGSLQEYTIRTGNTCIHLRLLDGKHYLLVVGRGNGSPEGIRTVAETYVPSVKTAMEALPATC
jgi:CheY-like chemotaxis protein/predicted regulator of Ras-like GTPase activity (Roadblock/LC7/MglB family)